jgi:5-methylcytosine-specific restriction endonuclease McrA
MTGIDGMISGPSGCYQHPPALTQPAVKVLIVADDDDTPTLPKIISRAEAKAKGLKRYFTGEHCASGHLSERRTSSANCVECSKRNVSAYRERNPEAAADRVRRWQEENAAWIKTRNAAFYQQNLETMRARSRAKYASNPEKAMAAHAAWLAANPGYSAEYARKRYRADPDKALAPNRNRRARKKNAGGTYTPADIQRIHDAQRGKCACCRTKIGKKYEVDHIQPISKGGSNWPKNLQLLCPPCNRRKHARDPIEFMQSLGLLL